MNGFSAFHQIILPAQRFGVRVRAKGIAGQQLFHRFLYRLIGQAFGQSVTGLDKSQISGIFFRFVYPGLFHHQGRSPGLYPSPKDMAAAGL